jgi:aminomethyltransferase
MEKSTPLYQKHLGMGAMMVPFAGWLMPLHYGSQLEEHHFVRNEVGVFDVSHMLAIDIQGPDATVYLRYLLANDVIKLKQAGKALYSCILNPQAGIIDDLIVYRLGENTYRCVVNAGTAVKDEEWMRRQSESYRVTITPRHDLSLLAVQGPQTFKKLAGILPFATVNALESLSPFHFLTEKDSMIAKTGYTGETGVEIMLPHDQVVDLWERLISQGVRPIGLGARDSLRLEAGLNLYGQDMDETVSPDESNLSWTIDLKDPERHFIGLDALLAKRQQGVTKQLVGVMLLEKGVCRPHMLIHVKKDQEWLQGILTSGSYSPTLNVGIGLARIPIGNFQVAQIEIRGKQTPAKLIKLPFYRHSA